MSYLQTIKYKKLPSGKKVYTEEVIASTPTAAKNAVARRLGVDRLSITAKKFGLQDKVLKD